MSSPANIITLSGVVGPDRLDSIETTLNELLDMSRPQVEVRLINVDSMHLGVVNVLVKARNTARSQLGDITVVVDANSHAQGLLATVGIVGTMRP